MAMAALEASKRAAAASANGNTGKRLKSPQDEASSPVKEKLRTIQRLMHKQGSSSADSSAVNSSDSVLEALGAISDKLDRMALKTDVDAISEKIGQMALKSDVETMTVEMKKDIKVQIAQAVDPIKSDLHDLLTRVTAVEQRPSVQSPKDNSNSSFALQKMMDKMDPAKKRIAFIGFPDNVQEDARIQKIEEFIKSHAPSYRIVDAGCFYSGPYNNQKLTRVWYAEFGSQDTARKVPDKLSKSELKVNGASIGIKAARTKLNGTRNHSLRSAEEQIKASDATGGAEVILDWKERVIKVGTKIAFKQEKADITGSFLDPFSSLTLP